MNSSVPAKNFFCFILIILNAGFAACASGKLKTAVLSVINEDSEPVRITVEIARTEEERALGLMHRKKLPDGEGMLFIFERDQQLSFWMKNTLIPLSIAFIASDGRITEIRDMRPHDLNPVQSSRSVRYALEAPQGWFARAGIKPGNTVIINVNPAEFKKNY
ncbi:MAG: DUF192 domain-containing protein [Treponema sp.]|jgi:uncharacterized membrane protein (UPF0127 family)|nr:DUF192 domain-containing protein [Treponema sp.]